MYRNPMPNPLGAIKWPGVICGVGCCGLTSSVGPTMSTVGVLGYGDPGRGESDGQS